MNRYININKLRKICFCLIFSSGIGLAPSNVYAEETRVPIIDSPTLKEKNNVLDLTELMGIVSYEINKDENIETEFENIITGLIDDIPTVKDRTKDFSSKKAKLIRLEGNSGNEQHFLLGSYFIKVTDFNANKAGKQKVNIKYSLISMVERKMFELSNTIPEINDRTIADENNSNSFSKSIIVDVKDVSAPCITLSSSSATIMEGEYFNIDDYIISVTDDIDEGLTYSISGEYDTEQEGEYLITITAVDSSGNIGEANFSLTVEKAATDILNTAFSLQSSPYVWGGTSPQGFDCSGFVQYVFRQHGIYLPRTALQQSHAGYAVSAYDIKAGDIIIYGGGVHVGIYIGNGQVIHALNPSVGVTIGRWDYPYNGNVTAIRRIL